MSVELEKIREILRKDLDTVGWVPTQAAIALAASEHPVLGYGLTCEAIYVHMYNGKNKTEILEYLEGPMGLDEEMAVYFLKTALRVRSALKSHHGDEAAAIEELMADPGAERDVIENIVEACARTASEFNVPWNKSFMYLTPDALKFPFLGCFILLAISGLCIWGLISLIAWIF